MAAFVSDNCCRDTCSRRELGVDVDGSVGEITRCGVLLLV